MHYYIDGDVEMVLWKQTENTYLCWRAKYDLVLFCVCLPIEVHLLKTFTIIMWNVLQSRQLSNDYKSCMQTAKLTHGQQVVAISLVRWQIQLSWAGKQVEFQALHE